ncbi:hypothetical protein FRACYDRAFT_155384, partial [Fragilariopsis cylindrus CCMP1102]
CVDENENCADWANKGECQNNQQYMLTDCRKSCKSCIDLHEYLHREARRNIQTMKHCVNKHSECTHWWSIGECNTNSGFMHAECSPACQTC